MCRDGVASLNSVVREGLTEVTFKYKLLALGFQVPQEGVLWTSTPPPPALRPLKAWHLQPSTNIF